MAIKKTTTKKAAKKVAVKKAPAKKVTIAPTPVKKAPAKKATAAPVPVKKAPAKKAPVKKVAAKKVATSKTPVKKVATKKVEKTLIVANVDVGFGNSLYIRGEGAGLSWEKGTVLENISPYEWAFSATGVKGEVTFKFLINDEFWSEGDNLTIAAGGSSVSSPSFSW
ncbi:MAG: hypothetical protein AAF065_00045 [Verrucomicrobiota bacterium]